MLFELQGDMQEDYDPDYDMNVTHPPSHHMTVTGCVTPPTVNCCVYIIKANHFMYNT